MASPQRRRSGSSGKRRKSSNKSSGPSPALMIGLGLGGAVLLVAFGVGLVLMLRGGGNNAPANPGGESVATNDPAPIAAPVTAPLEQTSTDSNSDENPRPMTLGQARENFFNNPNYTDEQKQQFKDAIAKSNLPDNWVNPDKAAGSATVAGGQFAFAEAEKDFDGKKAADDQFLLGVWCNIVGGKVTIQDMASGNNVTEHELAGENYSSWSMPAGQPVRIVAEFGGQRAEATNVDLSAGGKRLVQLNFDSTQLQTIRKAATCLIMIPDGGFGSDFLFEDRQTIGTAAHCVVAEHIGDLEFVFDPTEP
ncbi:MAG: hypothetical protein KDA58_12025, partial [Planctomycetaceae bacterium]|nr:hypothetical protein [Planctomycetaceae bacterium]